MDPFSIAATAWNGIDVIDRILKYVTQSVQGKPEVKEFQNLAAPLRAVLTNINLIFKHDRGMKGTHAELDKKILSIIKLCTSTLEEIEAGLSRKGVGIGASLAKQVRDHFNSTDTATRLQNLDRYMRVLNTSLLTVSIIDSRSVQDSQIQVLDKTEKIYAFLAIEEERDKLVKNLPDGSGKSVRSYPEASDDVTSKYIKEWSDTVVQCISVYEPSDKEKESFQQSFTPDIRSKFLSFWQKVKTGSPKPEPEPEPGPEPDQKVKKPLHRSRSHVQAPQPVEDLHVSPMPTLRHARGHAVLNKQDLQRQIEEYRQEVEDILEAAEENPTWYEDAVSHQRHLIKLLEQRYEHYNEVFPEKGAENEKLADILVRQGTSESLVEATEILDDLLEAEEIDPLKRAGIIHSLALIFFHQKWELAESLANEALNTRIEHSDTEEHINETRLLLIEIYEDSSKLPAANALRRLVSNLSQTSTMRTASSRATYESQDTINARDWLNKKGFIAMPVPDTPDGRRGSFGSVFDAAHPEENVTPMQMAAREKDADALDALISAGANIELPDKKGATPLLIAAGTRSYKTVSLLISRGAAVDAKDERGYTALHRVQAARGGTRAAEALLEAGDDRLIHKRNAMGRTALHLAAEYGNSEMARILLARNANVNVQDGIPMNTPLHLAIESGHVPMAKLLVTEFHADTKQLKNIKEETAVDAGRKSTDPMRDFFIENFGRR